MVWWTEDEMPGQHTTRQQCPENAVNHSRRRAAVISVAGGLVLTAALACCLLLGQDAEGKGKPTTLESVASGSYADDWYNREVASINQTIEGDSNYQFWSKDRVRAEAFHLIKDMKMLARREFINHFSAHEAIVSSTSRLLNKVESQEQEVTSMGGKMQNLAVDLGSALKSLKFAVKQLDEKEQGYEASQKQEISEIQQVLTNHTREISDNRELIRSGYESAQQSLLSMRRQIGAILDNDSAKMDSGDEDLRNRIEAMKQALQQDVTHLTDFAGQVRQGLNEQVSKEAADVGDIQDKIEAANGVLKEHSTGMEKIRGDQDSIKAGSQSNADVLAGMRDKVGEAQSRLADLSKQLDTDDLVNKQALALASKTGEQISKDLDKGTLQVSQVNSQLETLQRSDATLAAQESGDFGSLHSAILSLQDQIKSAEGIKDDLATLASNSKAKIDQASSSIHDLAGQSQQLASEISRQSTDLTGVVARVAVLEAADTQLKDKSKAHSAQVDAEVGDMQDKLSAMMGLKGDIAALSAKTERELQKVAQSIDQVKAGGDAAQQSTDSKVSALKEQLDKHIADQTGSFTSTTADVSSLRKDVHELEAFQADASTLQRNLVKELTDVTQSLGILDTKFSGQNVDVKSRIAALESAVSRLPSKDSVDQRIIKATRLADSNARDLDALTAKVGVVKASDEQSRGDIASLDKDLRDHQIRVAARVSAVDAKLDGEGKVLKSVAKALKDSDLDARVTKIFGR